MIDRIRQDIQQRLDQLLAEADKLRHALTALDPRQRATSAPKSAPTTRRPAETGHSKPKPAPKRPRASVTPNSASSSVRTPPGQTKANVLGALSRDRALTASQVAAATGLARPTVSTTLSRLAKTGDIVKADRGYMLPSTNDTTR